MVAPIAVVVVVARRRGGWWVVARSPRELRVACFCTILRSPLVDGGGGGGTRCPPIAAVGVSWPGCFTQSASCASA